MSISFKLHLYLNSIICLSYLACYHVISLYAYTHAAVCLILPTAITIYYLIICLLHKCKNDINNNIE